MKFVLYMFIPDSIICVFVCFKECHELLWLTTPGSRWSSNRPWSSRPPDAADFSRWYGRRGDGWWVFDGSTGWWFQTCLEFSIWDVILPIDEVIFFSGVGLDHGIPPTSLWWIILMMISPIQLMDKVHPSIYSWYYDDNIHLW